MSLSELRTAKLSRIAIHSVPRSGSTWLGELFNSSLTSKYCFQPLFSYALKDFLDENSSLSRIDEFFNELETTKDDFICQTEKRKSEVLPSFEKNGNLTHIVYKEVRYINVLENMLAKDESVKFIGLIRNPLAVLSSWLAAPKEFNPLWDKNAEWYLGQSKNQNKKEEFYGFKRWVDAGRIFHNLQEKYPGRVKLVKYSDMIFKKNDTVDELFEFASFKRDEQVNHFISDSSSRDVNDTYSVFRSKPSDDGWKSSLSADIVESVRRELNDDPLSVYLND